MDGNVVAVDLGASNGRLFLCSLQKESIVMEEVHRFSNGGVVVNGRMYWDVLFLFQEIIKGLQKAAQLCPQLDSFAIDTWGVDFGLLDTNGELLATPYHYRDAQANGMIEEAEKLFGQGGLFARTGVQDMWFNTVYQLLGLKIRGCTFVQNTNRFLLMADLLGYMLTGNTDTEYTAAATTQLYNVAQKK
ncbi:MAG: FGGY family carbohydrate kinase, partial [Oscillospiraceae bacterium]